VAILAKLTNSEIDFLSQKSRTIFLQDGEELFAAGDIVTEVYFAVRGEFIVTAFSSFGKAVQLRDPDTGLFGAHVLINRRPSLMAVTASGSCQAVGVDGSRFLKLAAESPALHDVLMTQLAMGIRTLVTQVVEFGALSVRARIHAELLRSGRSRENADGSAVVSPAPTHTQLADRVGANRETVTRELSRLHEMGIVSRAGPDLVIRDIHRLGELEASDE
jgi:CRP-like cAMP-binding protein